jgi:hypothetical protein
MAEQSRDTARLGGSSQRLSIYPKLGSVTLDERQPIDLLAAPDKRRNSYDLPSAPT